MSKHVRHRLGSPAGPGQVCEAQVFQQCQSSRQSMTPTRKPGWRARFSLSGSPSSTSFVRVIVDNCPAHPKVKGLKNVTLFFLPPNTTSKTQPIDQDVIRSLKHNYRKLVIAHHLRSIEKKREMEKITVSIVCTSSSKLGTT